MQLELILKFTSDSGILVAPGILPEANSSSVLTSTMTGSLAWTAAVTSSNPQDIVLDDIKIQIETGGVTKVMNSLKV